MPNKICTPVLLIIVLALVPCPAGAPAWASDNHGNSQIGDYKLPWEPAHDEDPRQYVQPPQFLEEGRNALGVKDATNADQDDFILASRHETQRPVVPASTACVEIGPVGDVGILFLRIDRRNGSCEVDLEKIGFYLNDPECMARYECSGSLSKDVVCRYPSPRKAICEKDDPSVPCVDFSDVKAAVNVICTPENAACNECINWETGSPTCTDYRTPTGVRIKMCVLENGKTCPWKKCCKKKLEIDACGY